MKRFFCEKCNGILPKGKIVCDKCGHENSELFPILGKRIKQQIVIRRIARIAAIAAVVVILHANFLFPWQWKTLNNKMAMLSYAKENYPDAKIIGHRYESAEFNAWRSAVDGITLKWNDIEFSLLSEDGRVIRDNYWHGVAYKSIYDTYLSHFFEQGDIGVDCEIIASNAAAFLKENPNDDITHFDGGGTRIIIYPQYIKGKNTPQDLGWLYDFYCYCKKNILLKSYKVTIIYQPSDKLDYYIHFTQDSGYNNEEEFYLSFSLDST